MLQPSTDVANRAELANYFVARLASEKDRLKDDFWAPARVQSCHIDELLPEPIAREIYARFPSVEAMTLKSTLRERKYVSAQMNKHASLVEEAVYGFQDERVVGLLEEITRFASLEADVGLYAGGISTMIRGHYLRPHLDNSHDKDQHRYRVLNLLYYVTPDWNDEYGGNLELWDDGPEGKPRQINSRFNRLVIMATNRYSWHSVSQVRHDGARCCVSNYYFSEKSPEQHEYFHATSFRGRPEEKFKDKLLRGDNAVRTALLRVFGPKVFRNPHVYKRPDQNG